MVRFPSRGSRMSRFVLRRLAVLSMALLLAVGSLASFARPRPAFADDHVSFVHQATSDNSSGDFTLIDHPLSNNNPGALLFVTANQRPDGVYTPIDSHLIGVWYDSWAGKWGIFNEDQAPMVIATHYAGPAFNVTVFAGATPSTSFVHTTTPQNLSGFLTEPVGSSSDPSTRLLVTQNFNPSGGDGTYNNHPIGVSYDPDYAQWFIYQEDVSQMPQGASFNVWMLGGSDNAFTQVVTDSNRIAGGTTTCIDNPAANGNPHALLFITHFQGPTGFYPSALGVDYFTPEGRWCIFPTQFSYILPISATIFVDIVSP